jgi:hypothetical protein
MCSRREHIVLWPKARLVQSLYVGQIHIIASNANAESLDLHFVTQIRAGRQISQRSSNAPSETVFGGRFIYQSSGCCMVQMSGEKQASM